MILSREFCNNHYNNAHETQQIEQTTKYTLNATPEEIWFWTSKLLDDEINTRALNALAILSSATEPNNTTHPIKEPNQKSKPQRRAHSGLWSDNV